MTVTRTQAGKTPRKTQRPDFVETPARRSRSKPPEARASRPDRNKNPESDANDVAVPAQQHLSQIPNDHLSVGLQVIDGWERGTDPRVDRSGHFEFGGSLGVSALMAGFPLLMYYMWIGATYYNGKPPWPEPQQSVSHFLGHLGGLAYQGAFPSVKAWAIYWLFLAVQAAFYLLLPGIYIKGRPLRHANNHQLTYYCSGMWSLYTTIAVAALFHTTGIFKLYTIMDEFGPLMSVAILSGFAVSITAYCSAVFRDATHRMSGYPVYDFFMGAELNPRMFGLLDFKMFFEVRLPWFMLLLMSLGTAARQYELHGYVTGEVAFLCMAHFLYANACCKGEECIVPTWDIYYEKWGFMLIFWNMAGVPMSYCHCILYLANHDPSEYRWPPMALAALYLTYLFVYWVWDTSNSQKNRFKAHLTGHDVQRKAFPQLPWQAVSNPKTIVSESGDVLLADGWYAYARKLHYTCDLFFALSWGLVTGFSSPFPWFYPLFFSVMIAHRAIRDIQRCRSKYGDAWVEFERQVPWLFVPYVF